MKKIFFISLLSFSLLSINTGRAEEEKQKSLAAIEFLSGFGRGDLVRKPDYKLIPFLIGFDFDLKPLTKNLNFNPPQLLQFQIEPFISYCLEPDSNIETGTSFFLKAGLLPETSKFQPYLKAGMGLVYMSLHTSEQSTQFNFTEQGCVGLHYYFAQNTAFTLEGRFRHLSNAGIKQPNHGINTYFVTTGIYYKF